MMSWTEHSIKTLRKSPLFQRLIPMEAGIGWPIPVRKKEDGKFYVRFLLFGQGPSKKPGKVNLFPPLASMTITWADAALNEIVLFPPLAKVKLPSLSTPPPHFLVTNPAPELCWEGVIGSFPHPSVEPMGRTVYLRQRQQLLNLYDDLLNTLAHGGVRSPKQDNEFGELLGILIEPSLVPYYRAIAPKFMAHFLP